MKRIREEILSTFSILPSELNRIIATAPHRYKVFNIPKRHGGTREIAQPAKELKILQNWLVDYLQEYFPIHNCATAYRKERGIKHNAQQHLGNRYFLKMDLENFFPSIVKNDIQSHFALFGADRFTKEDIDDICRLILWSPPNKFGQYLCIGAPSSPFISNALLFNFDREIFRFCMEHEVTYTRYADDLIFSTNKERILHLVERCVYDTLRAAKYPKLTVNKEKTIHTSKGRGVTVTGVGLTPAGQLSLGRDRKRLIRASIHHFLSQKLNFDEVEKLNGLLAFAQDIEPSFVLRMRAKYGADILEIIRRYLSQNRPAS